MTIDEICQTAGTTKSTFYYHFASKDGLLTDFYENTTAISSEALQVLATSNNCWQKIWVCMEPVVDWTISEGVSILSQVFVSNIQNQTDSFTLSNEPDLAKLYISIIEKGQEKGQFENRSDPKLIYRNIKNITVGIALQWCISGGNFDEKQAIKECISSMLSVREDLL